MPKYTDKKYQLYVKKIDSNNNGKCQENYSKNYHLPSHHKDLQTLKIQEKLDHSESTNLRQGLNLKQK